MKGQRHLISSSRDFPNLQVFARDAHTENPVISIVFKNTEWPIFSERMVGNFIFVASIGWLIVYFVYVAPGLSGDDASSGYALIGAIGLALVMMVYGAMRSGRQRTVMRVIVLDWQRGQLRVLRNGRLTFSHELNLQDRTIEPHPETEAELKKLKGGVGPKQRQHCLFGWFGAAGANKMCLLCRYEWPNQQSLLEVLKAIDWAAEKAADMRDAARGSKPFRGRMVPAAGPAADQEKEAVKAAPRPAGRGSMKPPLD